MILLAMDRALGATFYVASGGGSGWLYSNLFWLMGHPEVYVILLPAFAALLELTPVFTRKPLFSFNGAVVGIAGIVGLSLFVWAHHMYMAGWAPALAGPFMVTTEMISVPTGLLILVLLGHDLARPGLDAAAGDGGLRRAVELHHRRHHRDLPVRRAASTRPCTGRCSSPRTSTTR